VKIVHLQGTIGSTAQIGRTASLEAGSRDHDNWEIIFQDTGDFTQAKAKEVMESVLEQNAEIDVVYCENDNMAFGAIDAIEAAGKTVGTTGDIIVLSFDATRAGLEMTLKGKISFDAECNPLHGPRVDKLIQQLERGETPEKFNYAADETFDAAHLTKKTVDEREY
jgi:simple sugar transport system substrate-binding protein